MSRPAPYLSNRPDSQPAICWHFAARTEEAAL